MTTSVTDCRRYAEILYFCYTDGMKTIVTITSRGVVTLPAKLRQDLGLGTDDQLIAETVPEGLLLRPAVTLPVEIYRPQREREFDQAEADLAAFLKGKTVPKKRGRRVR
jgi:AbrB family looped-hinge helix DNA binding protein